MNGRTWITWIAITATMGLSGYLAWIGWGPTLGDAYVWLSSPIGVVIGVVAGLTANVLTRPRATAEVGR